MATFASAPVVVLDGDTIKLPADIASRFHAQARFVVIANGDTLILKRLSPISLIDLANTTFAEAPALSPDEVDQIVHEVRAERRRKAQS